MTRRFWISVVLALPVVLSAMSEFLPGDRCLNCRRRAFGLGSNSFWRAPWCSGRLAVFRSRLAVCRKPKLEYVHAHRLGVGVAFVYSVVAAVLPGIFPASFRIKTAESPYTSRRGVITTLVLLGQVLELRARSQTGAAIRALSVDAKDGRVIDANGSETDLPLEQVAGRLPSSRAAWREVPADGVGSKARDASMNR
jgi:Cu+-exporting ATPase